MRRLFLIALLAVACEKPKPPASAHDAGAAPAAPIAWPKGMTDDLVRIHIRRPLGANEANSAMVHLEPNGLWRMDDPYHGDADPDAVSRLEFVLKDPAVVGPRPQPHAKDEPVAFQIDLTQKSGTQWHITTYRAPLNTPVPVYVEGVGDFLISPVEFGNKIPDPGDFAPPGLWTDANGKATSLKVKGPVSYELAGKGEDWHVVSPKKKSVFELDDFQGIIVGRQAIGHPAEKDPAKLGLDPPIAIATLCAGAECRDFKFGKVEHAGKTTYYAQAPNSDPIELRDNDWKLIVDGPFIGRRK